MSKRSKAGPNHGRAGNSGALTMGAAQETPRPVYSDVSELPADLQRLVERMLVEGATFEDAVDAVNERGREAITLQAVENFFRSNLPLQQQRIGRLIETAKALRKALGRPRSGMADLADALIMTGLMRVSRRGANFDLPHAMRARTERETLHLKQQLLRLKARRAVQEGTIMRARTDLERAKLKLLKGRIIELYRFLDTGRNRNEVNGETYQRIREIYGIAKEPIIPFEEKSVAPAAQGS